MLEMTKSMMGLMWAGAMFAGRGMTSLLVRQDAGIALDDAAFLMDHMAEAMVSRLGPSGQSLFRAGMEMQHRFADTLAAPPPATAGTGWGPVPADE